MESPFFFLSKGHFRIPTLAVYSSAMPNRTAHKEDVWSYQNPQVDTQVTVVVRNVYTTRRRSQWSMFQTEPSKWNQERIQQSEPDRNFSAAWSSQWVSQPNRTGDAGWEMNINWESHLIRLTKCKTPNQHPFLTEHPLFWQGSCHSPMATEIHTSRMSSGSCNVSWSVVTQPVCRRMRRHPKARGFEMNFE